MSMTHEEAARILDPDTTREALNPYADSPVERMRLLDEACRIAAEVLRNRKTGEALTLEQLRGMDRQPAWCEERNEWGIIHIDPDGPWANVPFFRGVYCDLDVQHNGLTLYAYQPAHIDREEWVETQIDTGLEIVFLKNGKQIGKARVSDFDGKKLNFLHDFEVGKGYRNMGFGGKILEVLISAYKIDTLYADDDNKIALKLYEKYGFQTTDCFLKNGKKMCQMERKIPKVQPHIDREEWEPCTWCCSGIDRQLKHCAECRHFDISVDMEPCKSCKGGSNWKYKFKFCPSCGRPQEDKDWAELEKRMWLI